ncbi:MAG: 16S rRNA (guanine(966)-N(2))-methyltransferase RsmD, partial [bacterium]
MIITGGSEKGRKVKTTKSKEIRPTSSKVRQSIFNIIQSIDKLYPDMVMLDLFAGSGIVGIEALSRGIKQVVFVEKNPNAVKILRENLSNFDFNYELIFSDALAVLEELQNQVFDIIFIDPPYASGLIEPVLEKIRNNNFLAEPNGIIIVEHSQDYKINK